MHSTGVARCRFSAIVRASPAKRQLLLTVVRLSRRKPAATVLISVNRLASGADSCHITFDREL